MDTAHPLLASLERVLDLSDAERSAISEVPIQHAEFQADDVIFREGDKPSKSFLLAQGIACSSKTVADGGRQIMALHIPGDMPDLHTLHLKVLDSDLWAITKCHLAFMQHEDIRRLCHAHPRVADELWWVTLVNAAIYREWVVGLGKRQAISRLAHLFCEMMLRMKEAGLAQGGSCPLPITQEDVSDIAGMSPVHVNRTLQEIRGQGLISFGQGHLDIHDWDALVRLADFRPDYLHLRLTSLDGAAFA